jgi:hypothetical protein
MQRGAIVFLVLFLSSLALTDLGGVVAFAQYAAPTPIIVITAGSLACRPFHVNWTHISAIDFHRGPRFNASAVLTLDPAHINEDGWTTYIRKRGAVNCDITGTSADYKVVYSAIYSAWQRARFRQSGDPKIE